MPQRIFPFLGWFKGYSGEKFRIDLIAGLTVAMVLIPQSMAYAQLAGLPPYYGLYAAFLPPMVAALFGSSHQLATGPVAVVSLMANTALAPMASAGSEMFFAYAILLALIVGLFQFSLGVLRLGMVVNFLSHPVINGFTNAAALIIATSQLSKLFGVTVDDAEHHYETIYRVIVAAVDYTHLPSLGMAVLAFAIMIGLRRLNPKIPNVLVAVVITTLISFFTGFNKDYTAKIDAIHSDKVLRYVNEFNEALEQEKAEGGQRIELNKKLDLAKSRNGKESEQALRLENEIAILNIRIEHVKEKQHETREALRRMKFQAVGSGDKKLEFYPRGRAPGNGSPGPAWRLKVGNNPIKPDKLKMSGGGSVVGEIPKELPGFKIPVFNLKVILTLLPMAIIISLLGFMEAISIAKAMAAKTGQRLDPNQELIGQGLANIVGSCFKGYPVSGSFSRSAVNLQAGAVTGLSSVISSLVVGATILFFTPLLYHLPQAVLAAIIMMAVAGLINVSGFIHAWQVQKYDGAISIIAFVFTLAFAPHLDKGIMIGVVLSIGLYLLRNTRPDIALLSLHYDSSFREAKKNGLDLCEHIAVIRFNGSLFFANVSYLESVILDEVSGRPHLKHILLVCNGVNELDASGEEMLSIMVDRLREAGYEISFSGFNDSVLDVMRRTHLYEKIGEENMFRSVHMAMHVIHAAAHRDSREDSCPLRTVVTLDAATRRLPVAETVKKMDMHRPD